MSKDVTERYATLIIKKQYCPSKSTVYVKETFTGKIFLPFKNQELSYKII